MNAPPPTPRLPPPPPHSETPGGRALPTALLLAGLALFTWGRLSLPWWHFSNADVAGMTYNADLLLDGELPYVASIEGKAPGTFFVTALVFALTDRSLLALTWAFAAWQLVGAWAIWVAARQLHGAGATLACALATALYLASAGWFDLNYSVWMAPAYAWAFAAVLAGLRTGRRRWHLLAGACVVAAFLLKRQAVVLVPLFPLLQIWARRRGWAGAARRAWPWWILGALGPPAPLLGFYASRGFLAKLVTSIFPLSAFASYADVDLPIPAPELVARVLGQAFATFPLAVALCLAQLVAAGGRRRTGAPAPGPLFPQVALVVASVLAGALGGPRFYTHYLIQYLPGLALLAARPGLVAWLREPGGAPGGAPHLRTWIERPVVVLLLALGAGWHAVELASGRAARRDGLNLEAARWAGRHIAARTAPDDRIFVWGWTAWPTYYWANRRAPVMGYKSLGLLTDPNTNSAFFGTSPIHFRRGVHAEQLMRAFREHPPAYFVYSAYFRTHLGLESDPLMEWPEFLELLEREYEFETRFGEVSVYAHVSLAERARRGLAPAPPEPQTKGVERGGQ